MKPLTSHFRWIRNHRTSQTGFAAFAFWRGTERQSPKALWTRRGSSRLIWRGARNKAKPAVDIDRRLSSVRAWPPHLGALILLDAYSVAATRLRANRNMKIIVSGLIATYPLGGVSWDYVQYVKGLHLLGHEVFYLEDTGKWGDDLEGRGKWVYNPQQNTFTQDCSFNLRYLENVLGLVGPEMNQRWCFRSPRGEYFGLNGDGIEKVCNQADLFLNVSGCCLLRERYQGCRRKVYIDTDPLYTQYKLEAVRNGTATSDEAYSVESINNHDSFFTLGENVGDPSCRVPCCGLTWHKTRQPIVLEDWRYTFTPTAQAFTTVMSWKNDDTLPSIDGETYGGKNVEFMKFMKLPSRISLPM